MSKWGKRLWRMAAIAGVAGGAIVAGAPAAAQGDLLVAPTRVVIDGRRGTEVILSNIGSQEAVYRVNLELRRMGDDGRLIDVPLEEANMLEQAALEMIRYAPRRITLPPGQPQAIRIATRPPEGLPDGEYRAHMSFRAIPRPTAADPAQASDGVAIQLIPIYAVSIPIIIRQGKLESQLAMSHASLAQDADGASFQLVMDRSGSASTFGELRIFRGGSDELLYRVAGVAVYPEVDRRVVSMRLTPEQAAALRGPVRIEYVEAPENGGRLIASLETVLG